jgi:hypothetical protein
MMLPLINICLINLTFIFLFLDDFIKLILSILMVIFLLAAGGGFVYFNNRAKQIKDKETKDKKIKEEEESKAKKLREIENQKIEKERLETQRIENQRIETQKLETKKKNQELEEQRKQEKQRILEEKKKKAQESQRIWEAEQQEIKRKNDEQMKLLQEQWRIEEEEQKQKNELLEKAYAERQKLELAEKQRREQKLREEQKKEEQERKRKVEEETRRKQEREARFKPSGVLYEPIPEKDLKKCLSIFPCGSKLLCEGSDEFTCPGEIPNRRGILPCLLENVLLFNPALCNHKKKALCLLDETTSLMQMPIMRTLDNWIGIPACLKTYMPATHIVSFPPHQDPIFAKNKKDVDIESEGAILIPAYSDMLKFIKLHCEITKCSGVELGSQIFGLLNGEPCQNRCAIFLYLCMFGAEVARCPRWFGINMMLLDLICCGKLTWDDIFAPRKGLGFYPPSTEKAVQSSKEPCDINLETIQEEDRIIDLWLKTLLNMDLGSQIGLSQPKICEILFKRLSGTDFMLRKK